MWLISTHAPAGGATRPRCPARASHLLFLLTPLREGRPIKHGLRVLFQVLISTHAPAGGATAATWQKDLDKALFLLTPLREGRLIDDLVVKLRDKISTHAPAGGATITVIMQGFDVIDFYSRPCGRGDLLRNCGRCHCAAISTHAPAGGATRHWLHRSCQSSRISTHAPAGGATAIFHKSVMRFCGKLPKDDTVLCLASFGFPRRDPKAVYLAWISCANLPQKCVRQGLALKDQGTSCFHEGLASHTFDPVLV